MPEDVDFSRFVHADDLDPMTTDRLVKLAIKLHDKTDVHVEVAADEDAQEAVIEMSGRTPASDTEPAVCSRSQLDWLLSLIAAARRDGKREALRDARRAIERLS